MARANYSLARRAAMLLSNLRRMTRRFVSLLLNDQSGVLLMENDDALLSEN